MGTTADKLTYLAQTKTAIHDAIEAKGVTIPTGDEFRNYATHISNISSGGGDTPTADVWVRPTEWLALPDNQAGVQKVSILNAVFDTDSEFVALQCQTTVAGYTVDWGDGTIENFNSNIKAEHKYTYSGVALNSATVAKFGYKQCIITVTPQVGANIVAVVLQQYHTSVGSSTSYDLTTGFLDMRINGSYIVSLTIGTATDNVRHTMLEQCLIGEHSCTSFGSLFNNCYRLQSVNAFNIASVTDLQSMFQNCYSLQKCPNFTFRTDVTVAYTAMFNSCYSLIETPEFNIKTNSITSMFSGCYSIFKIVLNATGTTSGQNIQIFNNCYTLYDLTFTMTGFKTTSGNAIFSGCGNLREIPNIDWSACTSINTAFNSCRSLVSIPQLNTTNLLTDCGAAFSSCVSLVEAPIISSTANVTDMSSMFNTCSSLVRVPLYDTGNVTTMASMFTSCTSLKTVPLFNTVKATTMQNMFNGCSSLVSVPAFDITALTLGSTIVSNCYSLKKFTIPTKFTFSVTNAKMSATALDEMYTALPTVTGQTVTVTGNYGTASDNPSIATAKGWTVTG